MITVSVCMIVRDEEAVIRRCLSCVRSFADEIIVVDTGSKDQTASVCKEMGAKVYDLPWQDDFAAARNYAFSKAACDYQFWLDADDVISEADQEKMKELKETLDESVSVVMMRYEMQHAEHESPVVFERERLLRKKDHFLWKGRVHESIEPSGKIMHSDIVIRHRKEKVNDPQRNLRIFRKMKAAGDGFSPRDQFYYARELYQHGQYDEAVMEYETFLNGHGWVEDQIQACLDLGQCLMQLNHPDEAFSAWIRSFFYAPPAARICNALGFWFLRDQRDEEAEYWFRQALHCMRRGGFEQEDDHCFIPSLELAILYYYRGQHSLARAWFEQARHIHPQHPLIIRNQKWFS